MPGRPCKADEKKKLPVGTWGTITGERKHVRPATLGRPKGKLTPTPTVIYMLTFMPLPVHLLPRDFRSHKPYRGCVLA